MKFNSHKGDASVYFYDFVSPQSFHAFLSSAKNYTTISTFAQAFRKIKIPQRTWIRHAIVKYSSKGKILRLRTTKLSEKRQGNTISGYPNDAATKWRLPKVCCVHSSIKKRNEREEKIRKHQQSWNYSCSKLNAFPFKSASSTASRVRCVWAEDEEVSELMAHVSLSTSQVGTSLKVWRVAWDTKSDQSVAPLNLMSPDPTSQKMCWSHFDVSK